MPDYAIPFLREQVEDILQEYKMSLGYTDLMHSEVLAIETDYGLAPNPELATEAKKELEETLIRDPFVLALRVDLKPLV